MRRICLSLTVLLLLLCMTLVSCEKPHVHEWGEWQTTKEATCQDYGQRRRECACGASGSEATPKAAHTYENGTCTVCGATETEDRVDDPSAPDLDWYS